MRTLFVAGTADVVSVLSDLWRTPSSSTVCCRLRFVSLGTPMFPSLRYFLYDKLRNADILHTC